MLYAQRRPEPGESTRDRDPESVDPRPLPIVVNDMTRDLIAHDVRRLGCRERRQPFDVAAHDEVVRLAGCVADRNRGLDGGRAVLSKYLVAVRYQ